MYVQRNTEVRSRKRCCSGKAITITRSEFVSVALDIQQLHYIVFRDLPLSTKFSHLINGTIKKKKNTEHKMCVVIFCTISN